MSSLIDAMGQRFSCRTYSGEELGAAEREHLARAAESAGAGPFGSRLRFELVAARPGDSEALKGLGTYGTIRGATAFLVGAASPGPRYQEDFGFAMERLVLEATVLGLGTCWLGGFFTRGSFARRMRLARSERIPAVVAVGRIRDRVSAQAGLMRRAVSGSRRRPWSELFQDAQSGRPLTPGSAGRYARAVEMVRRAPSASNRQPWRILKEGRSWHFFLHRGAANPPRLGRLFLRLEDLPRVDIGIALCHFELAAREAGLSGEWTVAAPSPVLPGESTQYEATWVAEGESA